jgi:hydrogenase maturation protease
MTPCILVAGIGNILLQDDGLGPQAIAQLRAQYEFGDEVELFDLGTPTLDFFDNLRGREVLLLIDALASGVRTGRAPHLR